ncbi:MAG: hypothetical protein WBL61_23400 [Bryobacteraceae bacterium]
MLSADDEDLFPPGSYLPCTRAVGTKSWWGTSAARSASAWRRGSCAVTEMRVTIPLAWAGASLFWNGLALEKIDKPGCVLLMIDKELLHAGPCPSSLVTPFPQKTSGR